MFSTQISFLGSFKSRSATYSALASDSNSVFRARIENRLGLQAFFYNSLGKHRRGMLKLISTFSRSIQSDQFSYLVYVP